MNELTDSYTQYILTEEKGKMFLQVRQGKTMVKFPITKSVISTLHWMVNKDNIEFKSIPDNTVIKF